VVEVLVIPDGASEPVGDGATCLERARMPALAALCREGAVTRVRTIPPGLPAGSEVGVPALLGWLPGSAVDRGALEAAAAGVPPGSCERAWRCDVLGPGGSRASEEEAAAAAAALAGRLPAHRVVPLRGHRLLVYGRLRPPAAALGSGLSLWPEGVVPPRILGQETVVVAAPGAAAGCARLMGARVVTPNGATGGVDTDLGAKAEAALAAIAGGAARVAVHVGAPDEAAHARDAAGKVAALERIDRELVAPLVAAVARAGGRITVCPDHGCDPAGGRHDAAPVPAVVAGAGVAAAGPDAFSERAVAELPAEAPSWAAALGTAA
jgi:2,3-bisphosphoglycerate-independent phosphoglycerate mutase